MPDLGQVGDALKLLGGGAVGWIGRVFSERNKRRRMRRHLYKEIAENFVRIGSVVMSASDNDLRERIGRTMNFSYFEHAQKDMDAFHDISDYLMILSLYRLFQDVAAAPDWVKAMAAASKAHEAIAGLVGTQSDTGMTLLKFAPTFARKPLLQAALTMMVPSSATQFLQTRRFRKILGMKSAPVIKVASGEVDRLPPSG
jgi:hypothetical protein